MRIFVVFIALLMSACNPGGNSGAPNQPATTTDTTAPTATITAPSGVQTGRFPVIITFSETVTGVELSDFVIRGGTASNLTGSGAEYTLQVDPNPNTVGIITIIIPADIALDSAGNANIKSPQTFVNIDTFIPTATIAVPATPQNSTFPVSVTFSEPVTGVTLSDFSVSGGTTSNFSGSATTYTFDISPPTNTVTSITVDVAAGIAIDASGNANIAASQASIAVDTIFPTVTLSAPTTPQASTFTVSANFSEPVTGIALGDFTIVGGSASNFTGSGSTYSFDVKPSANTSGNITISLPVNAAQDAAGNSNLPSSPANVTFDTIKPTVSIVPPLGTQTTRFTTNVTFSEPVTGLALTDFSISSGTASNFSGSGANYSFDIEPVGNSSTPIIIDLPANAATDAANNGNDAALQTIVSIDTKAPTATIFTPSGTQTSNFAVNVTFSEPVSGLLLNDFVITGATATNFSGASSSYSFDIILPTSSSGSITIDLPANAATDIAGNSTIATQAVVAIDTISPTVTLTAPSSTQTALFTVNVSLSKPLTGLALTDFIIAGGTAPASSFLGSGTTYSFDVSPNNNSTNPVTIDLPANVAVDNLNNGNAAATQLIVPVDTIIPSVTIAAPTTTQSGIFDATITFSKPVTGLTLADFTITGSSSASLTGSGTTYTLRIKPPANSSTPITIDLPANAATDTVGHGNSVATQAVVNVATLIPIPQLSVPTGVQNSAFPVTITFLEPVTGLTLSDFVISGGTAAALTGSGANYTLDVKPASNSTASISIDLPANTVLDASNTGNAAAIQQTVAVDTVKPIVTSISVPTGVQTGLFTVNLTFSEPVSGFASSDLVITNGTAKNLQGSGSNYSFSIAPAPNLSAIVAISLPANTVNDAANNPNQASSSATISIDTTSPSVVLSAPTTTQTALFSVSATFSETVTNLSLANFVITGGTATNLAGSASNYTFDITPFTNSTANVTVSLPANSVQDVSANGNIASNLISVPINTVAPTVSITKPAGTQTGPFSVLVNFTNTVTGLTLTDFNVSNGTPTSLIGSGAVYRLYITPPSNATSNTTVDLPADVAFDGAGNGNLAAPTSIIPFNTTAPSVTIAVPAGVQKGLFTATVTFSSSVTGATLSDFIVTNGVASNFVGSGASYTFDITPNANSTSSISIDLPANRAFDAAGTGNLAATQRIVAVNTIFPSVTLATPASTQTTLFTVTATFSESMTGVSLADFIVTGGSTSNFVAASGTTYTFDVTPTPNSTANITIDLPANTATNAAGNGNSAATQKIVSIDTTSPSVVIAAPTTTQSTNFIATITFSEPVTGLIPGDFSISGGTTNSLTGTGATYTLSITPAPNSLIDVVIDLPANRVIDAAGNSNTAAAQVIVPVDSIVPTVNITKPTGIQTSVFAVTATFSESMTGVALADFVITGGSTSNFVATSGTTYTFDITPTANSTANVIIDLPADSATDAAGNGNTAATQAIIAVDTIAPTASFSPAPTTPQTGLFTVTTTFSEAVTGLTLADFVVTGGTTSNFLTISGTEYTFDIAPATNSTTSVTIDLPANRVLDIANNPNPAATQSVIPVDTASPTITLVAPTTVQNAPFNINVTLSEPLTGLVAADFNVVGGTATSFTGSGTSFTLSITPTANSTATITVDLPANAATDVAGNGNAAVAQVSTPVDTIIPTVIVSAPSGTQSSLFTVTATFSEAVTGVALADFVVSGGTLSNFTGSGAIYTFDVAPPANSNASISVDLAANTATDLAGNANTAASQLIVPVDTFIPTATLSAPTVTQSGLFSVNISFSENVTGLTLGNFIVTGGVKSNLTGSGTAYTFDITPNPSTTTPVFINLPANAVTDIAGNGNAAALQINVPVDTIKPIPSITLPAGPHRLLLTANINFTKAVSGLLLTDFTVTGGTASNLTGTGTTYTLDITPTANSTTNITVDLPANVAIDSAGNGNTVAAQATTSVDTVPPTGTETKPTGTQIGTFPITITFSEPVTGLALADFTITGGTLSNLAGSGAIYTFDVIPAANTFGSILIKLPANSVVDAAGNGNALVKQFAVLADTFLPSVSIAAPSALQSGLFGVTATFSKTMTGVTLSDFIINNGTASNFVATSGTVYTFDITPAAASAGNITIDMPANLATDSVGNGNSAATQAIVPFDTAIPSVSINAPTTTQKGLFSVTATFSEAVTGVLLGDFSVSGGIASNFTAASATVYSFDVTPAANSTTNVVIDLPANRAIDVAGNGNTAATQTLVTIDTIIPSASLSAPSTTQTATFSVAATFSEPVTGVVLTDFSVSSGSISNLAGSGTSYTFDVTPAANANTNITISLPANIAFDAANNGNTAATPAIVATDTTIPSVILSAPAGTQTSLFTLTATFSENVTGLLQNDFTVIGGTPSNFIGSGTTYTFDITPNVNSSTNITVDLAANAVFDAAGNGNTAAAQLVRTVDTVSPTITINPPAGTQTGLFTVNVSLSEALTGLTLADFNVLGGISSNFVGAGTNYTFDITPNSNSTANVTIDIAAGAATDIAGNGNVAAVQSVVAVDTVLPTVTITPASGVQTGVFNVSVLFSENVTGFISSDISVVGGTLSNFTALSALSYTFDVTPPLNSTTNAVIDILANAAFDAAGNGNTVAVQAVVPIDTVSPTVSITAPTTTQAATFPITITFSEVMTGLLASDFVLTNGSAANLAGSGTTYTLDITPTTNISGNITIDLPANAAFDLASNGNLAATQKTVPIDTVAPTVSFSVPAVPAVKSNPFTLTATFTKNVTGLTLADFVVTGGTTSNFAVVNGTYRYKFDITPAAFSTTSITVDLPANAAADSFGNGNAASSQLVVPVDTEAPIISAPVNPYAFDVLEEATFNFNITATDTSAITYSLYNNIQPTNGTVTVNSSTGAVSYQGNLNYSTFPYGPDTFNVAVSDAYGSTSLLEVRPNVINVNDPPIVGPNYATGLTMNEDTTTVVDLYSFDPDTNTIYIGYILESVPPASLGLLERLGVPLLAGSTFGELDLLINRIKFAPAQDAYGASSFSFRLRDNVSPYAPPYPSPAYVYPITVLAQNDTPVIETNSTLFINQNDPATALTTAVLSASDVDNTNAQLTYTVTTLPNQGTINLTTFTQDDIINGLVTYTPNAAITGADSFAFSLTDNVIAAPITGTFNISITPPQAAITASSSKASGALVGSNVNIMGEVKDLYTNTPFANKLVRFTIQTSPYATFVANGLQTIDVQTDVNGLATAALTDNYAETMPILVDAVNLGISQTLNQTFASNTGVGTVIASSPCNTTWGIAGSPYYIQSNISIASGCTLQIDPSVIVKFAANTQMVVASGGTLNVLGQAGSEVIFTSRNDDTVGGVAAPYSTGTAAAGDWRYLEYSNGALGSISYAQIRYAGASGVAALRPYAAITIDHVSISDAAGNGIGIVDGSPQVSNIHILNVAQKGIAISDHSSPTFTGINTIAGIGSTQAAIWLSGNLVQASFDGFSITGGQYNLHILSGAKATFTNNTFSGAVSEAVHLERAGAAVSINSSNTISNTPAPYLMAQAFSPSDIYASLDAATVSDIYSVHLGGLFTRSADTLVADPLGTGNSVYRVVADVQVEPNAILQIDPYTIIKFNNGRQLRAGLYYALSRIDVLGGVGAPVIFTSVHDNSVGAALPGSTGSPTAGIWAGIRYNSALSSSIIQNAEIRYATTGLYVGNSSPSINNLSVTQFSDAGVHLRSTSGQTTSPNVTNLVLSTTDTSNRALYLQGTGGIVAPNINGTSITTASTSSFYGAIHLDGIAVNPTISNMTINGGYYGLLAINNASSTMTNNTFTTNTHNIRLEGSGTHTFTGNTFDGATSESVSFWNITPNNVSIDSSNTISNAPAPYLITGAFIPANTAATVDAATVTNSSSISLAGSIKTNTVLTADPLNTGSSVYRITGHININSGARLQIDPYTVLKFNNGVGLYTNNGGVLDIYGAAGAPAIFTSIHDDSVGAILVGSNATPTPGLWNSVDFQSGSAGSIRYADIRYAKWGVFVRNSSPNIENLTVTGFSDSGLWLRAYSSETTSPNVTSLTLSTSDTSNFPLYLQGTSGVVAPNINGTSITTASTSSFYGAIHLDGIGVNPSISNMSINGGYYGLRVLNNASGTFNNNTFTANTYNIWLEGSGSFAFTGNAFDGATGEAIALINNTAGNISIDNSNSITNANAIYLAAGGFVPADTNPSIDIATTTDIYSVRLKGNFKNANGVLPADPLNTGSSVYRITGHIYINSGARLQIDPYTVLKFNNGVGLYTNNGGVLDIYGAAGAPAIFTSIHDDSVGAILVGSNGAPTPGLWKSVDFQSGSAGSIRYADIRYARWGVYANNSSPNIENLTVTEFSDSGLWLRSYGGQNTSPNVTNLVLSTSDTNNFPLFLRDGNNNGGVVAPNINGTSITTASTSSAYGAIHLDGIGVNPSISNMTINGGYYGLRVLNNASGTYVNNTFANQQHNIRLEGSGTHTFTNNIFDTATGEAIVFVNTAGGNITIDTSNTVSNAASPYVLVNQTVLPPAAQPQVASNVSDRYSLRVYGVLPASPYTYAFVADPLGTGDGTPSNPYTSVYHVVQNLASAAGATITMDPYTILKMGAGRELTFNGQVDIYGTPSMPVYFTSIKDDTLAGDTNGDNNVTSPARGDWYRTNWLTADASSSVINNLETRYLYRARISGASPTFNNFSVLESSNVGIYIVGAGVGSTTSPTLNNTIINGTNNEGIYISGVQTTAPVLNGGKIANTSSAGAIALTGAGVNATISNMDISRPNGYAINVFSGAQATIENNTLHHSKTGVGAPGLGYGAAGQVIVRNNTITANTVGIRSVTDAATTTIEHNIISSNANAGITIGSLATSPTVVRNNLIVNNDSTVDAAIRIDSAAYATIEGNTIAENTTSSVSPTASPGLWVNSGAFVTMTDNIIAQNINSSGAVRDVYSFSTLTESYNITTDALLAGVGDIYADPLFTQNWYLQTTSPAIDAGSIVIENVTYLTSNPYAEAGQADLTTTMRDLGYHHTILPKPVSTLNSTVTADTLTPSLSGTSLITITPKDATPTLLGSGMRVTANVVSAGAEVGSIASIRDQGDGTYVLTFNTTAVTGGNDTITISVNGVALPSIINITW